MEVMELLVSPRIVSYFILVMICHFLTVQWVVLALDLSWRGDRRFTIELELAAAALHLLGFNHISHVGCCALIVRGGECSDRGTLVLVLWRILKLSLVLKLHLLIRSQKSLLWSRRPHGPALLDASHHRSLWVEPDSLKVLIFWTTVAKAIILLLALLNLLKCLILLECLEMLPRFRLKWRGDATVLAVPWHRCRVVRALTQRHSGHTAHAWGRSPKLILYIVVELFYCLIPKVTHSELKQLFLNSLNKATLPFVLLFDVPILDSLYL